MKLRRETLLLYAMFLSLFIFVEFFGNFRQILAEIVHNFFL